MQLLITAFVFLVLTLIFGFGAGILYAKKSEDWRFLAIMAVLAAFLAVAGVWNEFSLAYLCPQATQTQQ